MKKNYDNPTRRQCFNIPVMALPQFDASVDSFLGLMEDTVLADINKIIVTGCGDSYLAAVESKPAFDKYLKGTGCEMIFERAIDTARFSKLDKNSLLIVISASGSPSRIAEILERGQKYGCTTIALTDNLDSRAAKLADYVYHTNTPIFADRMPGLRNYFASLVSLFIMAAWLGEKLTNTSGLLSELREELRQYNEEFKIHLNSIDNAAFGAALDWVDSSGFEIVADGPLNASARFVAAKYAEVSGDICTVVDSENYCHVNTFIRPKANIGTQFIVLSHHNNVSRIAETIDIATIRDKRIILLVSDLSAKELGINQPIRQCYIPTPNFHFDFLSFLYSYIPGSIAAGYHAALINQPYFRGGGIFADSDINTLRTNSINIV